MDSNSPAVASGVRQICRHRSAPTSESKVHIPPSSQPQDSQIVRRTLVIPSPNAGDSARILLIDRLPVSLRSASLRFVISPSIAEAPTIVPSESLIGDTVSATKII